MNHTNGKMTSKGNVVRDCIKIGAELIGVIYPCEQGREAETEANARRLAACWNACEAFSTEALEKHGLDGVMFGTKEWLLRLERQRDQLIVEVESLRVWQERYRALRAALFLLYGDKHITWHSLHISMDDGNMRDSDVAFCAEEAEARGDLLGVALAYLLLEMQENERDEMVVDVDLGREWLDAMAGDVVVAQAIDAALAAKEGV